MDTLERERAGMKEEEVWAVEEKWRGVGGGGEDSNRYRDR